MKLYWSPKEVALLIDERFPAMRQVKRNGKRVTEPHPQAGELNIRKIRRWLHTEGALIKRSPSLCKIRGGVVLTSAKMRELWPDMWDKYCADKSLFDDDEGPCGHENTIALVDSVDWCINCGAHRYDVQGADWVLPVPALPG